MIDDKLASLDEELSYQAYQVKRRKLIEADKVRKTSRKYQGRIGRIRGIRLDTVFSWS